MSKPPAFQFSILTCAWYRQLATKIIHADGTTVPFSKVRKFHYAYREIETIEEFAKVVLGWLATEPRRFIIRGQLKPGLSGAQLRRTHERQEKGVIEPATIDCPPRRWVVLDIDDAPVPTSMSGPDKVAEAGYYVRDQLLPPYFRGVAAVAVVTASTGRRPGFACLRLFFVLREAADNDALHLWNTKLSETHTWLDPAVMRACQPIYTARPIFDGCTDPVPGWGRVRLLEGVEETLTLELSKQRKVKRAEGQTPLRPTIGDVPGWLLDAMETDAELGVHPVEEISDKAWQGLRKLFHDLDGCPKHGKGRHETLNAGAWMLARLVAECELPEAKARAAFFKAAEGMNNSDNKYSDELIQRHLDDAFIDVGMRACA
jgi:hypothetical protein